VTQPQNVALREPNWSKRSLQVGYSYSIVEEFGMLSEINSCQRSDLSVACNAQTFCLELTLDLPAC
jgi:hypothetical protein